LSETIEVQMTSALLAYVFATFVIGTACLGAVLVLARLRQDQLARAFLWFYIPLSMLVLGRLLLAQIETQPLPPGTLLFLLEYLESFVGRYGVMLALPLFAHRIYGVHHVRREAVLIGTVLAAFGAQHVTEIMLAGSVWDARGDVFENVLFAGIVLYSLFVAVQRRGKGVYPPLARRFLLLLLVGLPGTAFDLFVADGPGVRIYPLWYCASGLIVVFTLARRRSGSASGIPTDWALTDREAEVLRLVQQGLSNPEIARQLTISQNTVKTHMRAIFDKTGFRTRVALIAQTRLARSDEIEQSSERAIAAGPTGIHRQP
jgi:DNA-binding CsgD family transcriptional regulator